MKVLEGEVVTEGSDFRRVVAQKGLLTVREARALGGLHDDHGHTLTIHGVVFTIIKRSRPAVSHGVELERTDEEGDSTSAFLDFDELDELIASFDFIFTASTRMKTEDRGSTEVAYATRDGVRFGFFQTANRRQQAFISLDGRSHLFLAVERLNEFRTALQAARDYLANAGATASE